MFTGGTIWVLTHGHFIALQTSPARRKSCAGGGESFFLQQQPEKDGRGLNMDLENLVALSRLVP